jgi:chromosome segregation ATPase
MVSSKTCLGALTLLSLASFYVGAIQLNAVESNNEVSDAAVPRSNYYNSVNNMINSISHQVSKELKNLDSRMINTERQKKSQTNNLKNMVKHISRIKSHLRAAQINYRHYNRARNQKYHDLKKLQHSLRLQAHYMRMEHKYVTLLRREAKKFKHYPKEYASIKKEIFELRRQLTLELNDLKKAYYRLHRKIMQQERVFNNRRKSAKKRIRHHRNHYNRYIGKYNVMRKNYHKIMRRLEGRLKKDKSLHGQLKDELKMLQELNRIITKFKPGDYSRLESKYAECRTYNDHLKQKMKSGNCTF